MLLDDRELQCRLASYNAALGLMQYEATLVWSKITALLVVDSLLAGALTQQGVNRPWVAVLGIATTLSWIVLVNRGVRTFEYWLYKARQDEELISAVRDPGASPPGTQSRASIDIITAGGILAKNQKVRIQLPLSGEKDIGFNWVERKMKGKHIEGWFLPLIFLAYFSVALWHSR